MFHIFFFENKKKIENIFLENLTNIKIGSPLSRNKNYHETTRAIYCRRSNYCWWKTPMMAFSLTLYCIICTVFFVLHSAFLCLFLILAYQMQDCRATGQKKCPNDRGTTFLPRAKVRSGRYSLCPLTPSIGA